MCGSVILCGGLFLAIMNMYNYHMLKKEGAAKDSEQNETNTENQDKVQLQTIETVMEKVESETKQEVETQNSPVPDETETPKQMWFLCHMNLIVEQISTKYCKINFHIQYYYRNL